VIGSSGLTGVRDADLVRLFRAVHRGQLVCPFTRIGLTTAGLLGIADELDALRGLDAVAVKAVLIAVIAERRARR
jgi:hypothetical protein